MSRQIWRSKAGAKITPFVNWNGGHPTIRVPDLLVRTALAYLDKDRSLEARDNLARLKYW
jgi:hypothetical protein